jgi:hypothetical protein
LGTELAVGIEDSRESAKCQSLFRFGSAVAAAVPEARRRSSLEALGRFWLELERDGTSVAFY